MAIRVSSTEARERILTTAERLLRERPYRELDVNVLMAEVGLSRTIFYRHFDGLPAVVLTLMEKITDELARSLVTETMEETLAAAVDAYAEHGRFFRAVEAAAAQDAAIEAAQRALRDQFTETMAGMFEVSMANGIVAPGNAYELGRAMNLMNIHYLLETFGRDPGFDRRTALDTLLAIWVPLTSHGS